MQDNLDAAPLYHLSAEQGYAHAQSNLGYMVQHGEPGVMQDIAGAV